MQDKTLKNIQKVITEAGLEAINCRNRANTGHISIQDPDEIGELGSVSYNFQNSWGTMKFSITINNKRIPSQPGRNDYFDFYMKFTEVNDYKHFRTVLQKEVAKLSKSLVTA